MGVRLQEARLCFIENLENVGEKYTDPERWNLYSGLVKLCDALEDLERTLVEVRNRAG